METFYNLETRKKLFDFFDEKMRENLPEAKSMQEAFEMTNERIGFQPYASFHSYICVKKRSRKAKRA